ncbi:hypothetical protein F511_07889 [Dorcoceras hygrometricum]|uniref:Uncharacterized protein n=1 Tax=Dorcoceras hygrometricum TaxID=472368 RepID=A0A2Z7AM31_9LAMI|nr:hypothetical protein F511_07889 [Dorcoceras hygrometricum]
MASSFISNAHQVNFESVLAIPDNEGMLNMFRTLEASGLHGFLGCQSVLYEQELEQYFDTALVQDGDITGVVSGKFFSISQSRFAEVFDLPTEGLVDFSEVPKNLVYDARSIFSKSGEPVPTYGKKKLMKYEYRLLNDILAKAITVKAGSFDAVTNEGFLMMTSIQFGLKKSNPAITMGEAVPFPTSKVLSIKTVHTYIVMNETIDAHSKSEEPGMAKAEIVKRKSKSKKESESTGEAPVEVVSKVMSKKRPTIGGDEPVVPKKRRMVKSKASPSESSLDMVNVAQEAERVTVATIEDVEQQATVEVAGEEPVVKHTDEVDIIIGQVLVETSQMGTYEEEQLEQTFDETNVEEILFEDTEVDKPDNFERWLDESYEDFGATEIVDKAEGSKDIVGAKAPEKAVGRNQTDQELMSIDYLLMQISDNMMLPSVTATEVTKIRLGSSIAINEVQNRDWYYASLPRISIHDKGKEPLEEVDIVKGNPAREMVALICGDVKFLVQLRDHVMKDVVEFFHSFSLNKLSDLEYLRDLKEKEKLMLGWAEADSLEMVVRRRVYILAKFREMLLRKFWDSHRKYYTPDLLTQQKEHGIIMDRPSSSQPFKDLAENSGAVLAQFYYLAKSTCWIRPMVLIDGVWTPIQGNDYWRSSCGLSLFVIRKQLPESVVDANFVFHACFIEPVQYWGAAPSIIHSWGWYRVCTEVIRYSMFGCLRPVRDENLCRAIVAIGSVVDVLERLPTKFCSVVEQGQATDNFVCYFSDSDVQSELESTPEINLVSSDGSTVYRSPSPQFDSFQEVAAIRSELFDFQAKVAENYLNLSTQLGDLVDYIRGGDAKKGEGSSSRPQPPPNDQGGGSDGGGSGARTTNIVDIFSGSMSREDRGSGRSGERHSSGNRSGHSNRR